MSGSTGRRLAAFLLVLVAAFAVGLTVGSFGEEIDRDDAPAHRSDHGSAPAPGSAPVPTPTSTSTSTKQGWVTGHDHTSHAGDPAGDEP